MPYMVSKRSLNGVQFLTFDVCGYHSWTYEKLDAIRFMNPEEIHESCDVFVKTGAMISSCDDNGHYEFYKGYEIQLFVTEDNPTIWAYRICPIRKNGQYTYSCEHTKVRFTSKLMALTAAKHHVDKSGPPIILKLVGK